MDKLQEQTPVDVSAHPDVAVDVPAHPDLPVAVPAAVVDKPRRVSLSLIAFFAVVVLLFVFLDRAVIVEIPGSGKRPFQVNLSLLCLAGCVSLGSWIMLIFSLRYRKLDGYLRDWIIGGLSAVAVFAPVCFVIAALRPAPLLPDRDYVFVPPQQPVEHKLGVTFLYPNGRDFLLPSEISRLADEVEMLRRCDGTQMELRGFASSAPYRTENEAQNLLLANNRAESLAAQLRKRGLDIVPFRWPTFIDMIGNRRIRDVDAVGGPIRAKERLNRRVEVWWTEETACIGEVRK